MNKNFLVEIIDELKKFVFKKKALLIFLIPVIILIVINRFSNFQFQGYLLSDIASSLVFALVSLVSILGGRPMVAYTSALARGWPLKWYWQPKVKPAYSQVTIFWFVYFSLKALIQWRFLQAGGSNRLVLLNQILGWPALIILLIFSYICGRKRLQQLQGPAVEEFKQKKQPPWQGQQKGF
jgi:hypothetical protein